MQPKKISHGSKTDMIIREMDGRPSGEIDVNSADLWPRTMGFSDELIRRAGSKVFRFGAVFTLPQKSLGQFIKLLNHLPQPSL